MGQLWVVAGGGFEVEVCAGDVMLPRDRIVVRASILGSAGTAVVCLGDRIGMAI